MTKETTDLPPQLDWGRFAIDSLTFDGEETRTSSFLRELSKQAPNVASIGFLGGAFFWRFPEAVKAGGTAGGITALLALLSLLGALLKVSDKWREAPKKTQMETRESASTSRCPS